MTENEPLSQDDIARAIAEMAMITTALVQHAYVALGRPSPGLDALALLRLVLKPPLSAFGQAALEVAERDAFAVASAADDGARH